MRFVNISEHGGPEVMEIKECEVPDPGNGEVLIRVHAAGVNRPDVMQRQGLYPPPPGASPILGLEVSGEVGATGADVSAWSVSDRVCALTNGGGYAEYVVVPAGQCLPVPEGLPVEEAAALPETFFTVWANVFDRARLKPGETFLVHGGSSGIGTTAIQLAKSMGAKAFTTAGSAEKCAACQRLGADVAVNYTEQNYVKVLKEATDGQGVDVILDMVGGDYVARNLELAAMDGRIVSISFLKGSRVEIDMMHILRKRLIITGSTLRPRSAEAKAGIAQNLRAQVWPLIESGEIKPLIAARFPLTDAAEAHRLMESSKHIGKIILTVAD
ncbi:MAG: NAD(P)H-quinone oxidoreductase [Deltaproteobacteria bacterium]|jgi:putative PIG3 family NAD(P)H quinone oxidoreductase|nr:NAD(P)H-quinone oxidoreductase [Deltaproteobacteria bacterium]